MKTFNVNDILTFKGIFFKINETCESSGIITYKGIVLGAGEHKEQDATLDQSHASAFWQLTKWKLN